jgi:predicted  nucleic acid-binding Zn-ribbon protein
MNSDPFYTFLAFVTQDTAIVSSKKKIEKLSRRRDDAASDLKKLQEILREAQLRAHTAKKNLDAQELEIKIIRDRQRVLKNKLESASSPKEYFSLETELKAIAADIDTQENKLFELFELHEELEKKMGEIDFKVVAARADTQAELSEIDQLMSSENNELNDHTDVYSELKHQVNPEMLERFLGMKEMLENPVVPVEKNACSACFNTISTQDLVSIRKHKLIACQNCFRLLYTAAVV